MIKGRHVTEKTANLCGSLRTLLGSLIKTYLPSGIFMQRSVTVRTMPHPFASDTLSCAAKSVGRTEVVLSTT